MNGENVKSSSSIEIKIPFSTTDSNKFKDDIISRVLFSLKLGLAVLLVSLLMLFQASFQVFGTNIIWSILTVVMMFEYTVGATFDRGFNRAFGSLLAGALAIAIAEIASRSGPVAEPIIIGASIFLVGTITTFLKLCPSLVPYEYGFRVILFTYCMIIVSGYRSGDPIKTSTGRLYHIAIGALVAVLVNVLVCPIWAGEELHKELVSSFNLLANSLEECVRKYLEDYGPKVTDEASYKNCCATLNSAAKIETLANSAKWEPPHGRFCNVYPWSEYVKVAAVLRYCAFEVMALHGVLHSEIQAPYNIRIMFQDEIREASAQAAELVRVLGRDIAKMQQSLKGGLLAEVHNSTEKLQRAIERYSCISIPSSETRDSNTTENQQIFSQTCSSNVDKVSGQNSDTHSLILQIPTAPTQTQAYHETMKKQTRRLYSWPSREVDAFEEGKLGVDIEPKVKTFENTAALSVAIFASLLIEFVARLDHLVHAVDKLSKIAKYKPEIL